MNLWNTVLQLIGGGSVGPPSIDLTGVEFRAATGGPAQHGENPRWDPQTRSVYWIDMPAGVLHCHSVDGATHRSWKLAPELTALVLGTDGRVLVGMGNELHWFDPASERREPWQMIPDFDTVNCRFNDAAWAPDGSLWLASMARDAVSPTGALFRVTPGSVETLVNHLVIGNGPAFDGKRGIAYYADTPLRAVYAVDLTRPFAPALFAQFGASDGLPDGMAVDHAGHLWIAHYDGAVVSCWSPAGERIANLRLPGTCPTALAMIPGAAGEITAAVTTSTLGRLRGGLIFVRALEKA